MVQPVQYHSLGFYTATGMISTLACRFRKVELLVVVNNNPIHGM